MTPAKYDHQVNVAIFDFMLILSLSLNFQVSHSEITLSVSFNEVFPRKKGKLYNARTSALSDIKTPLSWILHNSQLITCHLIKL